MKNGVLEFQIGAGPLATFMNQREAPCFHVEMLNEQNGRGEGYY